MKLRIAHPLFTLSLVLTAFSLLSGFKGCAAGPEPEAQCSTAADCEGLPSIACEGEWSCAEGMCVFACDTNPDECQSDSDCEASQFCVDGECLSIHPPPIGCGVDGECGPGQACVVPNCFCPPGAICGPCPEAQCVDIDPDPGCFSDNDCADGYSCHAAPCATCPYDAECEPCVSAGECVEDNVNPGQCGSDDDCGPNASCQTICDDGPGYDDGPGCDCGPDEDCLCADESPPFAGECWNVCIEKPQPGCSNDGGCGSGQVCELDWCEDGMTDCGCDDDDDCACLPVEPSCFGHCVEVTQPECSSSSDCGEGMLCQIEVCEDWSCDCDPSDEDDCYCPMVEPACWGVCVEATQPETCSFEDECGPGATCDIEYCETWTCDCDPSEDGENCSCPDVEPYCYGTCKDLTPPPFGCKDDADCGDNQYCDLPVCLMWCPVDDPDCCGTESLGQCQTWEEPPTPEPTPVPEPGQCVVSGCSGEICAASSLDSICIWEPWYECLALSTCGVNANGGCGWTQNDAFDACLQEALAP